MAARARLEGGCDVRWIGEGYDKGDGGRGVKGHGRRLERSRLVCEGWQKGIKKAPCGDARGCVVGMRGS